MEKSTKIIIDVIVFGFILPCAIILPLTSQQEKSATDLAGIRDYKAGHYDVAIQKLSLFLRKYPEKTDRGIFPGKSQYAQHYLGLALLKQHRYAEAVSVFHEYAKYAAGNEKYYLLGMALFYNGNTTEARVNFRKAIDSEMMTGMRGRDEGLIHASEIMVDKIDRSH